MTCFQIPNDPAERSLYLYDGYFFYEDYSSWHSEEDALRFVGFAQGDVNILTKADGIVDYSGYVLRWERVNPSAVDLDNHSEFSK